MSVRRRRTHTHSGRLFARDFAIALLIFLGLGLVVSAEQAASTGASIATWFTDQFAAQAATTAIYDALSPANETGAFNAANMAFTAPPAVAITLLLSMAFASIVAFKLAILRHLRRVHASPRRRSWRRD